MALSPEAATRLDLRRYVSNNVVSCPDSFCIVLFGILQSTGCYAHMAQLSSPGTLQLLGHDLPVSHGLMAALMA